MYLARFMMWSALVLCLLVLSSAQSNEDSKTIEDVQTNQKNSAVPAVDPVNDGRIMIVPNFMAKPILLAGNLAAMALIAKPLIALLASLPKPGLSVEIVTQQGAAPVPPQPVVNPPVPHLPVAVIPPTVPITVPQQCDQLGGFPCFTLPSGCYCPINTQMTWSNALQFCTINGGALLSIESSDKQLELETYLPNILGTNNLFTNIGLWTSGIYSGVDSIFLWGSDSLLPNFFFTNWAKGDPNAMSLPLGDCVRLVPALNYMWDDIGCEQALPFICQDTF